MELALEQRQQHADAVPVYVRPADDGTYRVLSTADDSPISVEHATPRAALIAALAEVEALASFRKTAVLRSGGEPDGEWRWLDATAVEDRAQGEPPARIGPRTVWDLAADLNTTTKPAPINGGPSPSDMGRSSPHGDARNGGDELANGWAHVGVPVVDTTGRTRLFLLSELLPEVAREVDRGRLAFGSVYFSFEDTDADDDHAIYGAQLISHALTNDPAVKTLSPGSERSGHSRAGATRVARRTTEMMHMPNRNTAKRGPATDKLKELAAALSVDISEEMEGDAYWSPIMQAVQALKQGAGLEKVLEGGAPETPEIEVEQARAARVSGAPPSMDPAATEAALTSFIAAMRDVFGKPDATVEDLLAELDARKEEIGAALGSDVAPDSGTPAEDVAALADKPGDKPKDPEKPEVDEEDPEKKKDLAIARAAARGAEVRDVRSGKLARAEERAHAAEAQRLEAEKKVARFETRDWLTGLLRAVKKSLEGETHEKWVGIALTTGRESVETLVKELNVPPQGGSVMPKSEARSAKTFDEATNLCLDEAREALPKNMRQKHVVWAKAQKLARERFPDLAATAEAG